jgi:Na+:H+ antiporter, NhaA family
MARFSRPDRGAGTRSRGLAERLRRLLRTEFHGGLFLLIAALVALAWANLPPISESYEDVWHTEAGFDLGFIAVSMDYRHWVNDALMVIVFFVIGLEIKREMAEGDLLNVERAVLPAAAAVGGILVPALIYLSLNPSGQQTDGWAIPTSTDIAFSLAVLALVGPRVSSHLRIFLLTQATVDDIAIIIIVALVFAGHLSFTPLLIAALLLILVLAYKQRRGANLVVYVVLGGMLWLAVLHSGVHPTIVGAVLGLLTPVTSSFRPMDFERQRDALIDRYEDSLARGDKAAQESDLEELESLIRKAESPEKRLEHSLVPARNLLLMPLFALANAGIPIDLDIVEAAITSPVAQGIVIGLVLGKPLGVFVFAWLAARIGIARLPEDTRWRDIFALSFLTGIGFTVSLFITNLALADDDQTAEIATIAIFAAAIFSSVFGWVVLRIIHAGHREQGGRE